MTTFCVEADINRLLSSAGVTDYADHDEDGTADTGVVDDCIEQASEEISAVANRFYADAQLATSSLVTRWCATMAAYYLCMRRGNPIPESMASEYERVADLDTGLLGRVGRGAYQLPGLAMQSGVVPSFSNLTVDRRYRRHRIRVTNTQTVDKDRSLQEDKAYMEPYAE